MGSSSSAMLPSNKHSEKAVNTVRDTDSSQAKTREPSHSQSSILVSGSASLQSCQASSESKPPPLPRPKTPPSPPPPPAVSSSTSEITSKTEEMEKSGRLTLKPPNMNRLKQKLRKMELLDHHLQSALKIVNDHEKSLGTHLECAFQCTSMIKEETFHLHEMSMMFNEIEEEERSILGDFLAYISYPSESLSFYKSQLSTFGLNHFNHTDGNIKKMNGKTKEIILLIRDHWCNFADVSCLFCASLVANGILHEMVHDMQDLAHASESDLKHSYTFENGINVLHNVSKLSANRQIFRDLKVVDIISPFLDYTNLQDVTLLVLLTLSYIIDDSQTYLLFSHESLFDLLISLANEAWKKEDLTWEGWSLEELLQGMLGLSKNDKVKRLLIKKEILSLLESILNNGQDKEQLVAIRLLWELSFDSENKDTIRENSSLMTVVKSLSTNENAKIRRSAQGALWVLDIGKSDKIKEPHEKKTSSSLTKNNSSRHVMISYNWGDQKRIVEIKDTLKSHEYNVWMDIENISGSTLQAMAEAVENAAIVMICMSEAYKESANCRAEAEYAFRLKKPIIPLLLQRSYRPDGWLGILLGTKLFFEFSDKYDFNTKIAELMLELGNMGHQHPINGELNDNVDGPIIKEKAPTVSRAPKIEAKILDVKEWLKENDLEKVACLHDLKSEHLIFLKKISSRAPEQYFKLMMDFLFGNVTVKKLDTLMRVTDGVEKLPRP